MDFNKKELKEILTEQREEYQRYLGTAIDGFESKIQEQREEYQRYLGTATEGFESKIQLVAESVFGIQGQLTAIREMVAKNTEDIEIMKMDLHIVKNELKEKVSRDEFKIFERRLELVEKKLQKV